jgi:citrate synthase
MDRSDQRGFDRQRSASSKTDEAWLSASEATKLLGIKRETLYAYASRGLVESRAGESGRPRRYLRSDIERLRARRDARAGHGAVAAGALRFGEPVLDSAITCVTKDGPAYRGYSAVSLARSGASFEAVAELLFSGELPDERPSWTRGSLGFDAGRVSRWLSDSASPLDAMGLVLALRRAASSVRAPLADEDEVREARATLPILAASAGLLRSPALVESALAEPTVAATIAVAFGVEPRREVLTGLDRALVLVADHELNVSTFGARVTASAATDLLGCLAAALSVLSGPRHGAMTDRVERLLDAMIDARDVKSFVSERLSVGEALPGFRHQLYPDGDPRAVPLLEAARKGRSPDDSESRRKALFALIDELARRRHPPPTIDFGLVAMRLKLGLPRGAAAHVFAVGRSAGWVAHILEQRTQGALLRPRARYVGPELR